MPVGDLLHCRDDIGFGGVRVLPIYAKEDIRTHERRALVSIDESMIPRQPEGVCGRQRRHVGTVRIRQLVFRPSQCRFQKPFVANPG